MTAELATFVVDQLAGDRVRQMFGGWGVYRDGEMVAIVYDGRTYIKATTEVNRARFIAAGMGPFQPGRQRTFNSFWEVPPEVLEDARTLRAWTEHAD